MHVIAPAAALEADPLPHAVASYSLSEAAAALCNGGVHLPEGAGRFCVSVDGTETEEDVAALRVRSTFLFHCCLCNLVACCPIITGRGSHISVSNMCKNNKVICV